MTTWDRPLDDDLVAVQEMRDRVKRARAAYEEIHAWSQDQADRVCRAMAEAGYRAAEETARLAVAESGLGRVESKIQKNQFNTKAMWEFIKDIRTVGVIWEDRARGLFDVAAPMGVVAAIIPITNPTSTAFFKILISVKARNAIVISPHPRGVRCIGRSAEVMRDAAVRAGAPEGLIQCLAHPTLEATQELMRHPQVAVILATGGPGLVKAAYSAGKPAIGVGPGNAPAYIDRSADIPHAVRCIVMSQTFDWGTVCASEQSLIVDAPVAEKVRAEFLRQGAYWVQGEEKTKLERLVAPRGHLNPEIVGLSPAVIAERAGFRVPESTTLLLVPESGVGPEYPLSCEKLSPILTWYVEDGWQAACKRCIAVLEYGGAGHTLGIHCTRQDVIMQFALEKPAHRILINTPTTQGSIGYSTHLDPSMTLGCGTPGNNIFSDNITPRHLINVRHCAYHRPDFALDGPAYVAPGAASWERPSYGQFPTPALTGAFDVERGRRTELPPFPLRAQRDPSAASAAAAVAAPAPAPHGGAGPLNQDDIRAIINRTLGPAKS